MKQAVILVGGRGTRLGEATRSTPKPLVAIAEECVFLDVLLDNVVRQGFDDVILLAGHLGEQVVARYDGREIGTARIRVVVETEPRGTGGALLEARDLLAPHFLLLNGDSYFDTNLRALATAAEASDAPALIALRRVPDGRRYGTVELDGARVMRFAEKNPDASGAALINAGVYVLTRAILQRIEHLPCSIESDVFPMLASEGRMFGLEGRGYFIDIGLPETLERARAELPIVRRRPAAFLDRDGVINVDVGYAHRPDQLAFVDGARSAIRKLNDAGLRVIVVTNQAGVARGYYPEAQVHVFHDAIQTELARVGAYVDRFYHCPFHPEGILPEYRADHPDRKPRPGMILRALADQPIDRDRSFLIGDRQSDLDAAAGAGVSGVLFEGGSLERFVDRLLETMPRRTVPETSS